AVDEKNYEEANDALTQIDEQMKNARHTDAIQQRLAELNDEGKKSPSRNGKHRGALPSSTVGGWAPHLRAESEA
ncbi:MAG: hypothetical protein AAGF97_18205, partial [Planctomycetota bacterium]